MRYFCGKALRHDSGGTNTSSGIGPTFQVSGSYTLRRFQCSPSHVLVGCHRYPEVVLSLVGLDRRVESLDPDHLEGVPLELAYKQNMNKQTVHFMFL